MALEGRLPHAYLDFAKWVWGYVRFWETGLSASALLILGTVHIPSCCVSSQWEKLHKCNQMVGWSFCFHASPLWGSGHRVQCRVGILNINRIAHHAQILHCPKGGLQLLVRFFQLHGKSKVLWKCQPNLIWTDHRVEHRVVLLEEVMEIKQSLFIFCVPRKAN